MNKKELKSYAGWLKTLDDGALRMELDQRYKNYVAAKELWELADDEHYRRFDERRSNRANKKLKSKKGK